MTAHLENFSLFFCLLFVSAAVFGQQSPAQTYLDKRNEVIGMVEKGMTSKEMKEKLDGTLEKLIQKAIGPFNIKGFPKKWKYNVDSLTRGDPGFYALDGMRSTSLDGKTQAVVSTVPLLRAWLQSQKDTFQGDMESALESGRFYTNVFMSDAYAYEYAAIPVTTSGKHAIAKAILFTYGSDYVAPDSPHKIGLTVIKNDLVYVFADDIQIPINVMPACKAAFEQEIRSGGGWVHAQDQQRQGQYTWGARDETAKKANENFLQCFKKRVSSQDDYSILVKQTQALIARVENEQKSAPPAVHRHQTRRAAGRCKGPEQPCKNVR